MVYDCFIFFNELELLELRLEELSGVVDKFVLVEATRTFRGEKKPLCFEENKEKYSKFLNRIIHIVVDDFPESTNPWAVEAYQRNMIAKGLSNCKPDDIIIISDVDEIPDPTKILQYRDVEGVKIFVQSIFYYFMNYLGECGGKKYRLFASVMAYYKDLTTPQKMRELVWRLGDLNSPRIVKLVNPSVLRAFWKFWLLMLRTLKGQRIVLIEPGGWHFSYLGGANRIAEKIQAFSHSELDKNEFKEAVRIKEAIDSGTDMFGRDIKYKVVSIDETFPSYLRNNIDRFTPFIKSAGSIQTE